MLDQSKGKCKLNKTLVDLNSLLLSANITIVLVTKRADWSTATMGEPVRSDSHRSRILAEEAIHLLNMLIDRE